MLVAGEDLDFLSNFLADRFFFFSHTFNKYRSVRQS